MGQGWEQTVWDAVRRATRDPRPGGEGMVVLRGLGSRRGQHSPGKVVAVKDGSCVFCF